MFCYSCGKQIPDEAEFCPYCGAGMGEEAGAAAGSDNKQARAAITDEDSKAPPAKAGKPGRRKIFLFGALGVALVLAAVLLLPRLLPGQSAQNQIEKLYYSAPISESAGETAVAIDQLILGSVSYEILSTQDGICQVQVTAPDMIALIDELTPQVDGSLDTATAQQALESLLIERLEQGQFQTRTVTVETAVGEGGNLAAGYELTDAMYGGLLSKLEQLLQANGLEG